MSNFTFYWTTKSSHTNIYLSHKMWHKNYNSTTLWYDFKEISYVQYVFCVILGEENPEQLAARAKRLKLSAKRTFLICDIDVENIGENVVKWSDVMCGVVWCGAGQCSYVHCSASLRIIQHQMTVKSIFKNWISSFHFFHHWQLIFLLLKLFTMRSFPYTYFLLSIIRISYPHPNMYFFLISFPSSFLTVFLQLTSFFLCRVYRPSL